MTAIPQPPPATQVTLVTEQAGKAPLTLDDLVRLLSDAADAGLPGTTEVAARVRIRGSRLIRLEVTGTRSTRAR